MAQTGMQRSLAVSINKKINGEQLSSYPRTYDGLNEFSINGITYPVITPAQMATMQVSNYTDRLAAFKLHIESLEPGLNFDSDTIEGAEAYRENLTSCPIG